MQHPLRDGLILPAVAYSAVAFPAAVFTDNIWLALGGGWTTWLATALGLAYRETRKS